MRPSRAKAFLECIPSFPAQNKDNPLLSKILRDGDGHPGKEMEMLFLLTRLLTQEYRIMLWLMERHGPEMLNGRVGAFLR